jgi:hypothetical protein
MGFDFKITRRDGQSITFAGLPWRDKQAGETIKSCAMIKSPRPVPSGICQAGREHPKQGRVAKDEGPSCMARSEKYRRFAQACMGDGAHSPQAARQREL